MHHIRHEDENVELTYGGRHCCEPIPKYTLPAHGLPPDSAYQLVADELQFDARASLNLASFVNTWMDPQADQLMRLTMGKNLIDEEEYPQTADIAKRVLSMIARLLHAPSHQSAVGCVTAGSSEALLLACLAHKRSWVNRRKAQGLPTDKPNIVFGADAHTSLEKCSYFDIAPRIVPMHAKRFTLTASEAREAIDENTIAIVAIAGTTFTGQLDDMVGIDAMLEKLQRDENHTIPLHIDAASGGFVLPFNEPDNPWDFRLKQVRSINVSNHKFGLVYPGMGTLIFREQADIPDDLVFHINYLGGDMPNYSLNFSRPSGPVVAQYYNMLRLGYSGYRRIIENILANARYLAGRLRACQAFEVLAAAEHLPVVVVKASKPDLDVKQVALKLRSRGWVVPAYTLPKHAEDTTVLRFVVRENMSRAMIDELLQHITAIVGDSPDNTSHKQHPQHAARRPIC